MGLFSIFWLGASAASVLRPGSVAFRAVARVPRLASALDDETTGDRRALRHDHFARGGGDEFGNYGLGPFSNRWLSCWHSNTTPTGNPNSAPVRRINVSGFKVWPAEVEAMMQRASRHQGMLRHFLARQLSRRNGESVGGGARRRKVDHPPPEDILSWSRDRMASYKALRSVVFVDGLPRSASNKISWRLLQDAEWKL